VREMTVSVHSAVNHGDGDILKTDITAPCTYLITDRATYLQYDETVDGVTTRCRITVEKGRVSVLRKGVGKCEMVFVPNEKNDFSYIMPFGAIDMTVKASAIRCELDENGGELELTYSIFSRGEKLSDNNLLIILS